MLDYCVKTWGANDIRIQKDEVSTVRRSYPFHSSIPPLYRPPSPSPLSALSFPLRSCLCLASARVWRTQTKERCLSWRKSKGLGSLEGGGGWPGGQALSKLWLSVVVFLDPLLIRRLTRPSLPSPDFLLRPPFSPGLRHFPE